MKKRMIKAKFDSASRGMLINCGILTDIYKQM